MTANSVHTNDSWKVQVKTKLRHLVDIGWEKSLLAEIQIFMFRGSAKSSYFHNSENRNHAWKVELRNTAEGSTDTHGLRTLIANHTSSPFLKISDQT